MVAFFTGQTAQTFTFSTHYQRQWTGKFGIVDRIGFLIPGADNVDKRIVHGVEGAGEIADLDDRQDFGGSACHVSDGLSDRAGTVAWNNDGIAAGCFGGANTGAEVVWILDAVEDQQEDVFLIGFLFD